MFEGLSKNVTCLGFYENGQFMYSGGEDCMARIWDLRYVGCLTLEIFATCMCRNNQLVYFSLFHTMSCNVNDFVSPNYS